MHSVVYKLRNKSINNPKIGEADRFKRYYGMVRNKKFKYYKDKTMKKMAGIIDFDRVQCVIMIDDSEETALV
jgi:hypothetical protein